MVVHPAKGHWLGTLTPRHGVSFSAVTAASRRSVATGNCAPLGSRHQRRVRHHQNRRRPLRAGPAIRRAGGSASVFAIVVGATELDRDVIDLPIKAHPYQRKKWRSATITSPVDPRKRSTKWSNASTVSPPPASETQKPTNASDSRAFGGDRLPGAVRQAIRRRGAITRGEVRRRPDDHEMSLARQALHARRGFSLRHPTTGGGWSSKPRCRAI